MIQGPARFWLERSWASITPGTVAFVMLNPSTADDANDDPTIRRCVGFAKAWGHASLIVVNTNPMRSTNPRRTPEPNEFDLLENDEYLRRAVFTADRVVCAWGSHVRTDLRERALYVLRDEGRDLHHLGLTKRGEPRHPLYLPGNLTPQIWVG